MKRFVILVLIFVASPIFASDIVAFKEMSLSGYQIKMTDLKIKYQDGLMYCQGCLRPDGVSSINNPHVSDFYERYFDLVWSGLGKKYSLTIQFNDKDNFKVAAVNIYDEDIYSVKNSSCGSIFHIFNKSIHLSLKNYKQIKNCTLVQSLGKWSTIPSKEELESACFFDYIGALTDPSITQDQIAKYLSQKTGYDYESAIAAGGTPNGIIDYLFETRMVMQSSDGSKRPTIYGDPY